MARAVGPCGMLDIRSAALLEDLTYAENPCAEGSTQARRQRYYGSEFFRAVPEANELRNPEKFDRRKDWIHCACASFICLIILGILHSIGLLLSHVRSAYKMGPLHVTIISAATYAIVCLLGPLSAAIVRCMGNRLTCIFGLLLFFTGLVLDALEINVFVYYIAHMGLMGFGGSFALTAAGSSVMRHFRKRLRFALAALFLAAPVGTALFHVLIFVFAIETSLGYKWIVLILSFFVLVSIALTHPLPATIRPPRHPNPFHHFRKRKEIVQDCIDKAQPQVEDEGQGAGGVVPEEYCCDVQPDVESPASATVEDAALPVLEEEGDVPSHSSCLCVCVFDVSAVTDLSFLLWAVVSSCSVVTLYVPYLFLIWYVVTDFQIKILDGLYIMLWLSLTSAMARGYIIICDNHTFFFNRTLFQAGCLGTGIIYLLLQQATTYGWLMIWGMVSGLLEGLIVGTIPRVTMLTIPRKYMTCAWSYLVFFNGCSLIIGPYLIISVKQATGGDIALGCIAIGIIQIAGGILAFFIPNEEYYEQEEVGNASEDVGKIDTDSNSPPTIEFFTEESIDVVTKRNFENVTLSSSASGN